MKYFTKINFLKFKNPIYILLDTRKGFSCGGPVLVQKRLRNMGNVGGYDFSQKSYIINDFLVHQTLYSDLFYLLYSTLKTIA